MRRRRCGACRAPAGRSAGLRMWQPRRICRAGRSTRGLPAVRGRAESTCPLLGGPAGPAAGTPALRGAALPPGTPAAAGAARRHAGRVPRIWRKAGKSHIISGTGGGRHSRMPSALRRHGRPCAITNERGDRRRGLSGPCAPVGGCGPAAYHRGGEWQSQRPRALPCASTWNGGHAPCM